MAWFRVRLTEAEQQVVHAERASHPNPIVRRRMLVPWLLHCGLTRVEAAKVAVVGLATVERIVEAYRDLSLDGLRQWNRKGLTSELASDRDLVRESFEKEPVRSVAEAADRIENMTGLRRGPTQVGKFIKGLGISLWCLPSYTPRLNLIERLWKLIKRRSLDGRYHAKFADFQAAIQETINQRDVSHRPRLASLMTRNFQEFKNVSLIAA